MSDFQWKVTTPAGVIAATTVVLGAVWLLGSISFFLYGIATGFFPKGLSLADIPYFGIIGLGFLFLDSFLLLLLYCLGSGIVNQSIRLLLRNQWVRRKYERNLSLFVSPDGIPDWLRGLGAATALFFLILLARNSSDGNQVPASMLIADPFIAALSIKGYFIVRRATRMTKARLGYQRITTAQQPTRANHRKLRKLQVRMTRQRGAAIGLAMVAFVGPVCMGMLSIMTAAAMRFASLRTDSTTAYVRNGYCPLIEREFPMSYSGVTAGDFCEVRNITFLMTSIGDQVALADPADSRHFVTLPAEDVVRSAGKHLAPAATTDGATTHAAPVPAPSSASNRHAP